MPTIDELIEKHAKRTGLDPKMVKRMVQLESGGDPNQVTGKKEHYVGLLQLDTGEFTKFGGTGSRTDPEQNLMAGTNKLAQERLTFKQKYNREPTAIDTYMVHQQGPAGYAAHMANPEGVAWRNVRRYYPNDSVAKEAIWRNMTPAMKAKYGSVDNVTSANFTGSWNDKYAGAMPERAPGSFAERTAKSKARHEGIPEDAGEPKQRAPIADTGPGFVPANVIHPSVEAPDIRMSGPITAPLLSRAGRVPQ
jgi:hypothetical protein